MKIIVPMAGMGKRMRPHTLTTPKPLVKVAGKPIVQRLVEDIAALMTEPLDEIAFIIGDFGTAVEEQLKGVAAELGAKGSIYYQEEALGTAHAIMCAEPSLDGKVIVAFADTLFTADFQLDEQSDGVLWVKQIDDPSAFGVVELHEQGHITGFVEKPQTFVSDLAMIGIYYFKDGANLKSELKYLMDNNIMNGGEYQLPDALRNMTEKGLKFVPGKVDQWMDCGNKHATVETNRMVLTNLGENQIHSSVSLEQTIVIPPCFIGEGAAITESVIGPWASIGAGTKVSRSVVKDSIVGEQTQLSNTNINSAMIGNFAAIDGRPIDASIGDYSTL